MRLYDRSPNDKDWNINRCHFDAEHSRVSLGLERLKDLESEFPNDAKIAYAEGVIRRDFLGQGIAALELFETAYHLNNRDWAAAENALLFARDEREFHNWLRIFQEIAPPAEPGRKAIAIILKVMESGTPYWQTLVQRSQLDFEAKRYGPSAALMELALLDNETRPDEEVTYRRYRAQCLRMLDQEAHAYRETIMEAFPPQERLALQEAVTEIDKAISIDEYDPELWNLKAAWCNFLGRFTEAIQCADRAIELRPLRYSKPYINKGNALWELEQGREALACARQALEQAKQDGSATDIAQASEAIKDYSAPPRDPDPHDLEELVQGILKATRITSDEEVGLLPSRSIKKLINGFVTKALRVGSERSLDYVPLVAEVLSDFTPETVSLIILNSSDYSQKVCQHCLNAALYVVVHSDGVQQRDAARFLVLSIFGAMDSEAIRDVYRQAILEASAAAVDELSHLDVIMREELNRMDPLFSRLIADQEPVDEEGRERAIRNIISNLSRTTSHFAPSVGWMPGGTSKREFPLFDPQQMPPLTTWGMVFNRLMLAMPFIGLGVGWLIGKGFSLAIGLLSGMLIACVGWIWFFFIKNHPGKQ